MIGSGSISISSTVLASQVPSLKFSPASSSSGLLQRRTIHISGAHDGKPMPEVVSKIMVKPLLTEDSPAPI